MQRQIFGDETYMYKAKQLVEQLFESILPVDGRTNVKFLRFSTPPCSEACTVALPESTSWMHPRRCRYVGEGSTLLQYGKEDWIYNQWNCRGGSTALWASVYEVKQSIY